MKKVHILPPDIVAKIAAGEVIDRPASVVKELIENSLDAGATSISLELEQAGKTTILIKDNGHGIGADDIETIFERHSTSKIAAADDLFNIHSLGFRGEALYSIAAVADVTLKSCPERQDSGWEIHLRGGEKLNLKPLPLSTGTEIEVKELFFNTPARRKFLKSNVTEMNQVLGIFIPYTLLYPKIHFALRHQDKTVLDIKPADSFKERIDSALNLDEKFLLEAEEELPEEGIKAHLILGDINICRSRRDLQFIFINDRPVQSKTLGYHLNNVYRLIMPEGNHPFFCLFLTIPASEVDVNIHPTKREVKIRDEQRLATMIRSLAEKTLMTAGKTKQLRSFPTAVENFVSPIQESLAGTVPVERRALEPRPAEDFPLGTNTPFSRATEQYAFPQDSAPLTFPEALAQKKHGSLQERLLRGRYLGAFVNKFLLFEADQSLLVIDQHAAQERITFEILIKQMQKGQVEVQHLLSPYLVPLTPQEILMWEEGRKTLEEFGFSSTQFDDQTIAVHSYPILLKDPVKAVREILAGENIARTDHETIARRACRASIMAGDKLDQKEAEAIRESLLKTRDPFTCPHGRPTVIEMKEEFLNKQFLRT